MSQVAPMLRFHRSRGFREQRSRETEEDQAGSSSVSVKGLKRGKQLHAGFNLFVCHLSPVLTSPVLSLEP